MISEVYSALPHGYEAKIITIEGDINRGLPSFTIIGMIDKTINEARERIRSAICNSNLSFPNKRLTINLAPAELRKTGSYLDLPIAMAILVISGQLQASDTKGRLFIGELSLTGEVRPVKGIINIIEKAEKTNFTEVILPSDNYSQAKIIAKKIKITPVNSIIQLFKYLKKQNDIIYPQLVVKKTKTNTNAPTLDQVKGQSQAKRALIIAIAGHHNILLSGPPGAGKSMLAKVAHNLLPKPCQEELIQITKIHALSKSDNYDIMSIRPFRSPHHSASRAAIIGGGIYSQPGEISLAHLGVLFLDELPEFSRDTLESLRQPLEEKRIVISRSNLKVTYPANFSLIATMNPCPCGYFNTKGHECSCTPNQIQAYRKKISGPILDRFDLIINVNRSSISELVKNTTINLEHQTARNNILQASRRQHKRYKSDTVFNSDLNSRQLSQLPTESAALSFLKDAAEKLNLSARTYFKTIKVAQTIADLDQQDFIKQEHIAEALLYRQTLPTV